ncbi:hypothetical protein BGZ65_012599 [Modicella reniformis]|uniref:Uncharacterized protein n=1 Tax=Modicella reniformis TaxID=1440133 RepID=A0A9P6MAI6_9FUNG|nr:hypothetical protein BGZ65_012599 [Modicella reniformis]
MAQSLAPVFAPEFVYKLIAPASNFNRHDLLVPLSDLDKADGFYHLSTEVQVPGTANRFFQGTNELVILKIRFSGIRPQVKWEAAKGEGSTGGVVSTTDPSRIFPHVYGELFQEHIEGTILLLRNGPNEPWDFSNGWQDRLQDYISVFRENLLFPHPATPQKPFLNMLTDIISQLVPSQLIPQAHTQEGLRQLQLTTAGFVVMHALLHLSLFMDGMVRHVFFAIEIGTLLLYTFVPVKHTLRPVALLKHHRLLFLVGMAAMWLTQPLLLSALDNNKNNTTTSLLFGKRDDLAIQVAKTLNQLQIERIVKEGGKVDEEEFREQQDGVIYAMQLATAIKCLAWMSILIAGLMVVEASFVWVKCKQIEKTNELSSAEKEKAEAQRTTGTSNQK